MDSRSCFRFLWIWIALCRLGSILVGALAGVGVGLVFAAAVGVTEGAAAEAAAKGDDGAVDLIPLSAGCTGLG